MACKPWSNEQPVLFARSPVALATGAGLPSLPPSGPASTAGAGPLFPVPQVGFGSLVAQEQVLRVVGEIVAEGSTALAHGRGQAGEGGCGACSVGRKVLDVTRRIADLAPFGIGVLVGALEASPTSPTSGGPPRWTSLTFRTAAAAFVEGIRLSHLGPLAHGTGHLYRTVGCVCTLSAGAPAGLVNSGTLTFFNRSY